MSNPIGVNIGHIKDWDHPYVFVDVTNQARPFWSMRGELWDSGEALELTATEYPARLDMGQQAASLVFNSLGGRYPGGDYVLLYDGAGRVSVEWDAVVQITMPGREVYRVTPSNAGLLIKILETDPNNPIRNLRLIMPGFEHNYSEQIFHPRFLELLSPFTALRFAAWQLTDSATVGDWSKRRTPEHFTQGGRLGNGVAPEYMIELCNRTNADPWFNIPHLADAEYVRNFATMVRDRLSGALKPHVEVSNEVWNFGFGQTVDYQKRGEALGLAPIGDIQAMLRAHSEHSVEVFRVFEEVYGGTAQFVRIMGGQHGNPWIGLQKLNWKNAHQHCDVLATAPYFGGLAGLPWRVPDGRTMTVDQLIAYCGEDMEAQRQVTAQHLAIARERGLRLMAYEGGQHLAGAGGLENDTALTNKFIQVNRDPRMRQLYVDYLKGWESDVGDLMMLFALAGRSSKWGSWGLVEWIDAPTGNYPKYMGTLDYLGSVPPAEEPEMPGVPILLNVERDSSVRGRVQINWTYDGPEAEIETRVRLQNLSAIMESPVTESPHEIDLREVGPLPDTAFWADFKIVAQNDVGMQESDVIRMDWPAVDIPPADGGDATAFEGRVTEIERILTELQDAHGVVAGRLDDHFQRITALLARLDSLEPVVGEAMQAADSALEVIAAIHEATKP